jgi:hypothetical protein
MKYSVGLSFGDVKFISSFVKMGQLVHYLKWGVTDRYDTPVIMISQAYLPHPPS